MSDDIKQLQAENAKLRELIVSLVIVLKGTASKGFRKGQRYETIALQRQHQWNALSAQTLVAEVPEVSVIDNDAK